MAGLLERRDEPEHRRVPAGTGPRRGGDPRDCQRLAGLRRERRRQDPASCGDLSGALEVSTINRNAAAAGGREAVRRSRQQACGNPA